VFIIPIIQLRSDTKNLGNFELGSSPRRILEDEEKLESLNRVGLQGFSLSCTILFLIILEVSMYIPDPLIYGSVTQTIAPVATAFIFYTLIYSTRRAWSWQK
jgi:hypothetical protein